MRKELSEDSCDAPTSSLSRTRYLSDLNLQLPCDPHSRRQLDRPGYVLVCKGMVAEVGFFLLRWGAPSSHMPGVGGQ